MAVLRNGYVAPGGGGCPCHISYGDFFSGLDVGEVQFRALHAQAMATAQREGKFGAPG
ncbi:unnamed protein product [Ectocarpus sp. CCAP 1310/34]|nr:unnamed protein product [Ectocarpus sp. CCAP 1310/34]